MLIIQFSAEAEVIEFSSEHLGGCPSHPRVRLDGIALDPVAAVRNLTLIFDFNVNLSHTGNTSWTAFFSYSIVQIRAIHSQSDAEELVHIFGTSRLEFKVNCCQTAPLNPSS